MKEILLVGRSSLTKSLNKLFKSSTKFNVTETQNPEHVEELVANGEPHCVLCTGTIHINEEGKYFLDIN